MSLLKWYVNYICICTGTLKVNRKIFPTGYSFCLTSLEGLNQILSLLYSRPCHCLAGSKSQSLDRGLKEVRSVGRGEAASAALQARRLSWLFLGPGSFPKDHRVCCLTFRILLNCVLGAPWPLFKLQVPGPFSPFLSFRRSTYLTCLSRYLF